MVVKVKFHLVPKRLPSRLREQIWAHHLVEDVKRSHDRGFLITLRPRRKVNTKPNKSTMSDVQVLALIKSHTVAR